MVNPRSIALTLGLLASSALGNYKAPGIDKCRESGAICLQRFRWCTTDKGCQHPGLVWSVTNDAGTSRIAALVTGERYQIGWLNTDPEYTTVLEFSTPARYGKDEPAIWSRNFTEGETWFEFSFYELAEEFPNKRYPNTSTQDVLNSAQLSARFKVYQPDRPWDQFPNYKGETGDPKDTPWNAVSDSFHVFDNSVVEHFIEQEAIGMRAERRKWKTPVIATVCSVVPVLLVTAFFGGKYSERRRSNIRHQPIAHAD